MKPATTLLLLLAFAISLGCESPQPPPTTCDPNAGCCPSPSQSPATSPPDPTDPTTPAPASPSTPPAPPTLQSLVTELTHRLQAVSQIADYTATLTKRERINGVLGNYEQAEIKIRHRPFSAYLKFTHPPEIQGREVLYVDGQNNNKMLVRRGGRILDNITTNVDINSPAAMDRNRYPITHLGIESMLGELYRIGQQELAYPADEMEIMETTATLDGRECRVIMFRHRVKRVSHTFFAAKLFIDKELDLPVRHEAYDWPVRCGEDVLIEEYTYTNLKVNVGLSDRDFDARNEEYGFRRVGGGR